MYGAQAGNKESKFDEKFENDVEMYGAQAIRNRYIQDGSFENDVEMYGAQALVQVDYLI